MQATDSYVPARVYCERVIGFTAKVNKQGFLYCVVDAKFKTKYFEVINRAFREIGFERVDNEKFLLIKSHEKLDPHLADISKDKMIDFLDLLKIVFIIYPYKLDFFDECFALDLHKNPITRERTKVGQLVYEAKPYNHSYHPGNVEKAKILANVMARFIKRHPTYTRADMIVSAPPSNANKPFDLPRTMVQETSKLTGKFVANDYLYKTRKTLPMKGLPSLNAKIENIKKAFEADTSRFLGKRIIVIDDICETGMTLCAVSSALKRAGARQVVGLTATKTMTHVI